MRMQTAACKGTMVFWVYVDLRKVYNSIHCNAVLSILQRYGVGPCIRRYITNVWGDQLFVLCQNVFYLIDTNQGVTQGDVNSLIIFNLIVDAVLCRAQGEKSGERASCIFTRTMDCWRGRGQERCSRTLIK